MKDLRSISSFVSAGVIATFLGVAIAGCGGGEPAADPTPGTSAPATDSSVAAPSTPDFHTAVQHAGDTAEGSPVQEPPGASEDPAETPATPAAPTAIGPRIEFTAPEHDYGVVWDTTPRTHRFEFVNVGSAPLVIVAVKSGCACTVATLDRMEYAPGERGAIETTYTPKGRGEQRIAVNVLSNARDASNVRLAIVATVKEFVTFDPNPIRMDDLKLGQEHRKIVTVSSDDPDLAIDAIEVTVTAAGPAGWGRHGDYLSARRLDPDPSAASGDEKAPTRIPIELILAPDAPWGVSYGKLSISVRGRTDPDGEPIEHLAMAHVVATVWGELQASHTMFGIGSMPLGTSFERSITLTRQDGEPFTIEKLGIRESTIREVGVRAVATEGSRSSYRIIVAGNTGDHSGLVRGIVEIRTDVPGEENLQILYGGMSRDLNK